MKVATFNVGHCQDYSVTTADDAPVDIEHFGSYIQELNADVIALNEVFMDGNCEDYRNQTEKIAKLAGYPYYVDAIGKDLPWASIGNAILSKYPIESYEAIPVLAPTEEERREGENEWYEDRVILSAIINVDGKKVHVIATHFGLNGMEKERMINALCKEIDGSTLPIIFMGDFNAKPHTEILAPIYDRLQSCADEVGDTEYTFCAFDPYITIDYIFVSKGTEIKGFNVRKEILSDHRACEAEIAIKY